VLLDSAIQLYFWGGATDPGMAEKMVGAGSQYALAFVDATDAPFDGSRTRRTCPSITSGRFWSTTPKPGPCCRPTRNGRL
jgi:hypothetical protein